MPRAIELQGPVIGRSVVLAAVVALAAGCGDSATPPGGAEDPPARPPVADQAGGFARTDIVEPAAAVPSLRTVLSDTALDLTGDGAADSVHLSVDAERRNGEVLWDDGQRWLLLVRTASGAYPLFDDYVQLGRLHFWAIDPQTGDPPTLVVLQETGAGLRVFTYVYAPDRDGFVRRVRLETSGNVIYSAPRY